MLKVDYFEILRFDDLKNDTRSYTLRNFRALLLISHVYKSLCFLLEASRAVKLRICAQNNASKASTKTYISHDSGGGGELGETPRNWYVL